MSKIKFGTDGWRAIIAEDYTFANVRICAQAMAKYLIDSELADKGVVIGYDTRFASEDFAAATAEVMAANGIRTYLCDRPAPTPTISYAILAKKAGGAVVITSSHNPAQWNGFKVKPEYAGSASPEVIALLEENIAHIQAGKVQVQRMPLDEALHQRLVLKFNPAPDYLKHIASLVDLEGIKAAGITVVVDAMFGAGIGYFPALLAGGNTRVIEVNNVRNPLFPGMHNPEPIAHNLAALVAGIAQHQADVGLATDGDADRVGLVDEHGQFINQLQVYALLLLYLLEVRGKRGPIVKTVTTTAMARKLAKLYDIPVYETPVGFKYVGPKMMETGAIMGGEESGGFGFAGHIPERDGILAGLFLLDLMIKLQKSPSQLIEYLYSLVGPHYYDRIDIPMSEEVRDATIARVRDSKPATIGGLKVIDMDTVDGFRYVLEDGGWLLIRFSGTEPLIRIYTETTDKARVQAILADGRKLVGL
ncbi:MAG: phosphoglucomutase/phosphomannomutase family protein [Chloroflexi bacterium]|nr:phosphoglucomutase/phosphomannomutase family protein [Chloroflexota bacterium]